MIDINELRRLAQAATHPTTKGRWMRLFGDRTVYDRLEDGCRGIPVASTPVHPPHQFEAACLDFIAAANPATISEILDRLEAAEKERDALRAALQHEADCVEAAKAKIEALRAKIAEIEEPEPARLVTPTAYRWRYRGAIKWQYGELTEEVARLAKEHNHEVRPLYDLPGAQPAPSVPTALLVAVADLTAQMEIVSRVGFVDTPNDKDSCAAFCVAEGTWLELMSAVESLASALAAAPEAKP